MFVRWMGELLFAIFLDVLIVLPMIYLYKKTSEDNQPKNDDDKLNSETAPSTSIGFSFVEASDV